MENLFGFILPLWTKLKQQQSGMRCEVKGQPGVL